MPAVNLISILPSFTSLEEHKNLLASTPNSFQDIPPVLRHREDHASIALDPALEGFSVEEAAQGTLYVLTRYSPCHLKADRRNLLLNSVLIFMSDMGRGFQIEYPAITLHAVSRGERGPSIYCQLDEHAGEPNAVIQEDEQGDSEMRELTIIPADPTSGMYTYMTRSLLFLIQVY